MMNATVELTSKASTNTLPIHHPNLPDCVIGEDVGCAVVQGVVKPVVMVIVVVGSGISGHTPSGLITVAAVGPGAFVQSELWLPKISQKHPSLRQGKQDCTIEQTEIKEFLLVSYKYNSKPKK